MQLCAQDFIELGRTPQIKVLDPEAFSIARDDLLQRRIHVKKVE